MKLKQTCYVHNFTSNTVLSFVTRNICNIHLIGQMGRVLSNGPGDRVCLVGCLGFIAYQPSERLGFNPRSSHTKD